jgi:hypothetical protein
MTTEQPPLESPEHRGHPWLFDGFASRPRRSRRWRAQAWAPYEADGGPYETDGGPYETDGGPFKTDSGLPADGTAPTIDVGLPESDPTLQGVAVSKDELAAQEAAGERAQAASERLPLPARFRQELRMQLADFAERAHQKRLNPHGAELLGQGGGITDIVVRAMGEEIEAHQLPSPVDNQNDRTLLLFGALAAAGRKPKKAHASFVTSQGRLMLDISAADGKEPPSIRFVRLPDRPAFAHQGAQGQVEGGQQNGHHVAAEQQAADEAAAGQDAAEQVADLAMTDRDPGDHTTEEHEATGAAHDDEAATRYAAVICGPAAVIANRRPLLSMDTLLTYARRRAFLDSGDAADPQAARRGMRVAHGIEIVVLMDESLGGGVWVDVDPVTGRAAAAMAIDLTSDGFEFLPIHEFLPTRELTAQPAS